MSVPVRVVWHRPEPVGCRFAAPTTLADGRDWSLVLERGGPSAPWSARWWSPAAPSGLLVPGARFVLLDGSTPACDVLVEGTGAP